MTRHVARLLNERLRLYELKKGEGFLQKTLRWIVARLAGWPARMLRLPCDVLGMSMSLIPGFLMVYGATMDLRVS